MEDLPKSIDLVITYVDGSDEVWKQQLSWFNAEYSKCRFRNWNFTKYWLRGIERNMPFIRKLHFVVSNREQVPDYINTDGVNVVFHSDIIPECLLPTFNSTTIEMFLHKIPGLAEKFIYSNDDTFANNLTTPQCFFTNDGLPCNQMIRHVGIGKKLYWMQCRNSWRFAERLAKSNLSTKPDIFLHVQHSMTPMLKSVAEEVHSVGGQEIVSKCTKFREPWNFNQYLFPDYAYLTGRLMNCEIASFKYHSLSDRTEKISHAILDGTSRILCLNDSGNIGDFQQKSRQIQDAFDRKYSEKSKYEK